MLVQKDLIIQRLQLPTLTTEQKFDLWYDSKKEYFHERPVSIERFYKDRYFLGNTFRNSKDEIVLFPLWQELLNFIYITPFHKKIYEVILEAPIGAGKTYLAVLSLLYELYKLNCLANPAEYYNLGDGTMIIAIIYSLDLNAANIAWNFAKEFMDNSPYFMHFIKKMTTAKSLSENTFSVFGDKKIFINVGSQTNHGISRAIHSVLFDESDFYKNPKQGIENYEALQTRVVSRFPDKPGMFWTVSSATSDGSFMDQTKQRAKDDKKVYIVNAPAQWYIIGRNRFPEETFQVFPGDLERDAFIVDDETRNQVTKDMNLIDVPVNYLGDFRKNLIKFLRDLANVRTSSVAKFYKSKAKLTAAFTAPNRIIHNKKPVEVVMLEYRDQNDTLIKYFEENVGYFKNPFKPHCLRFLHCDLGRVKDKFGIGCSLADYDNQEYYRTETAISRDSKRFYYTDWVLTVKAKPGQQIPYKQIVNLMIWLRDFCNYPIELISSDQQEGGASFRQDLEQAGFIAPYLSLDRSRTPDEVVYNIVDEERIIAPNNKLLFLETSNLIDNGTKVDHPILFDIGDRTIPGSNDTYQGWAGSVYNASKADKILNMNRLLKETDNNSGTKKAIHQNRVEGFTKGYFKNFYD